jgi:hypothetical protein
MKKDIINLSPYEPSQKMRSLGVYQLPLTLRDKLHDLLYFDDNTPDSITFRAKGIANIAEKVKAPKALVYAPCYMVASIEDELESRGIIPFYAYGDTNTYIREDKDRGTPERGVKWSLKALFVSPSKEHMLDEGEPETLKASGSN